MNQPKIATTEQPRQSVTSPNSTTLPKEHSLKGKHGINDSQSELFAAEIEKLKLEMEYIKLMMKKVSSEIEILELKKKFAVNKLFVTLSIRTTVTIFFLLKRGIDIFF